MHLTIKMLVFCSIKNITRRHAATVPIIHVSTRKLLTNKALILESPE